MTEAESNQKAFQQWGVDGRTGEVHAPTVSSTGSVKWATVYRVGFQEYFPKDLMQDNPWGGPPRPNPRAGEAYAEPTWKGSGTSWQKAWDSVK